MAWVTLLSEEQIQITADDQNKIAMMEVSSAGSVPRYVSVHFNSTQEIDKFIHALQVAKNYVT